MSSVKNYGGAREGAGRKPKAVEQKLIEKLSPLDPEAFKQLRLKMKEGEKWAIELFFKYKYGMPKQSIESTNININEELTESEVVIIKKAMDKKYL